MCMSHSLPVSCAANTLMSALMSVILMKAELPVLLLCVDDASQHSRGRVRRIRVGSGTAMVLRARCPVQYGGFR